MISQTDLFGLEAVKPDRLTPDQGRSRILGVMCDEQWRTASELAKEIGYDGSLSWLIGCLNDLSEGAGPAKWVESRGCMDGRVAREVKEYRTHLKPQFAEYFHHHKELVNG